MDIGYHLDRVKPRFFCPTTEEELGREEILATGSSFEKRSVGTGAGRTDEISDGPGVGILAPCDTPWIKVLGLLVREDQMLT